MFWIILLIIITVVIIWPHWFGIEYNANGFSFVWRTPGVKLQITDSSYVLFIFSKKIFSKEQNSSDTPLSSPASTPHEPQSENETSPEASITPLPDSILNSPHSIKSDDTSDDKVDETMNSDDTSSESSETVQETKAVESTVKESKENTPSTQIVEDSNERIQSQNQKKSSFTRIKNSVKDGFIKIKTLWLNEKGFIFSNWKWFLRFLKQSFKFIKPIRYHLRIKGGFIDPSLTGSFAGFCHALHPQKRSIYNNYIDFTPVFIGEFEWFAEGDILWRTSVGALLQWILITIITFPYWEAFKFYKRHYRDKKVKI